MCICAQHKGQNIYKELFFFIQEDPLLCHVLMGHGRSNNGNFNLFLSYMLMFVTELAL